MCTFYVVLALLIPIARFLCNCQASTTTTITAKTMFVRQDGPNVVKLPTGVTKHMSHETVGKRVGGSRRHQLGAAGTTSC